MIDIRPAKLEELEIILDYQQKMALETENLELDSVTVRKGIEAVFKDSTKGTYFVAVDEKDKAVACLLITPEWSEWRNGTVMWIQSVYVIKPYRGKGVFKKMYQYLQRIVETEKEWAGIRLYVEKENIAAQKVYEAIGMNGNHYQLYEWMPDF